MTDDLRSDLVFTDGACTGNPGPGGWAAVLVSPQGDVVELGGGDRETTNNRMEILATIRALEALEPGETTPTILLYTDSTYVIRGITQWIWAWRQRGWKTAEGNEVNNQDLWKALSSQVQKLKPSRIEWRYVKGHSGVPGNERCDEIAVGFAKGKRVKLYNGPLLNYDVAIFDLPENHELPELKPFDKREKKSAHSYLSYHGGIVYRHADWASCERRVRGQSAAKFKKAMSAADESEILRSWGLDPDQTEIKKG